MNSRLTPAFKALRDRVDEYVVLWSALDSRHKTLLAALEEEAAARRMEYTTRLEAVEAENRLLRDTLVQLQCEVATLKVARPAPAVVSHQQ